MKIALSPDLHCFYNTNDKLTESGKSKRRQEWINSTNYMFDQCVANGIDTVIFPGDYFVNPKPNADKILMVSNLFHKFEKAKIKVLGTTGNHDISGIGAKTMDDIVSEIGGNAKWCISQFEYVRLGDVGFGFLPYVKAPEITAYNPDYASMEMSQQLTQIAGGLSAKMEDDEKIKHKILIGHWSIQGAVTSSGVTMQRTVNGVEVVLPLGEIASQGWEAMLFGHIHKPQILNQKKPFVAYSGCIQRINIGEANDDRGFYIYDTETEENQFINIPAIEMKSYNVTINSTDAFNKLIEDIKQDDIKNKIVQVRYNISKNDIDIVDKRELTKVLDNGNPMSIVGILPRIIEIARQRDISLTESLDANQALIKWLDNKGVIEEEKGKILALFTSYKTKILEEA